MRKEYHKIDISQESPQEVLAIFPPGAGSGSLPRASGEGAGLPPCLSSNISPESEKKTPATPDGPKLSPYYKRQAHTLHANVVRLSESCPSICYLAFITLTFQENIKDHKEAGKRFDSFNKHFLHPNPDYGSWINVKERQEKRGKKNGDSGALHYHMVIQTAHDIRTGFDFDLYEKWLDEDRTRKSCPTGNDELRRMWRELREAVQKYGFGWIVSVEPIKSTKEAISRYVGKYVSKHLQHRIEEDKGARMINYSRGFLRHSPKFQWLTMNSALWRSKVQMFSRLHGCTDLYELREKLGPKWAYNHFDYISGDQIYFDYSEHLLNYKYEGENRIDKDTGEIVIPRYEDRILKMIPENDRMKTQLLHAEVLGEVGPKATYKHWQKTKRMKEEAKSQVHLAKIGYRPTQYDLDEVKENHRRRDQFKAWLASLPDAPF